MKSIGEILIKIGEAIMPKTGLQCKYCWIEVERIEQGKRTVGRGDLPMYKHIQTKEVTCGKALFEDDVEPLESED